MKIAVITTIAQHYKGIDLHLNNLKWALSGLDYKIFVQTFENYKFDLPGVEIIKVNKDPNIFYPFYDGFKRNYQNIIEQYDLFFFIEQDILITDSIKKQIIDCYKNNLIQINLESEYLNVYNSDKKFLYPRIWEGATLIPSSFIKKALEQNISFGITPIQLNNNGLLYNDSKLYYTTSSTLKRSFFSIEDYVKRCFVDTFFEFSFFSFKENLLFKSNVNNVDCDYEYGNQVVHFRGVEIMCRDEPGLYKDFLSIRNLSKDAHKSFLNNCTFMLIMSGVHVLDETLISGLLNNFKNSFELFKLKLKKLKKNSKEWMSDDEYKIFLDIYKLCISTK